MDIAGPLRESVRWVRWHPELNSAAGSSRDVKINTPGIDEKLSFGIFFER